MIGKQHGVLMALLLAATDLRLVSAFTPSSLHQSVRTSTSLNDSMAAYDAQMKALAAGGAVAASPVAASSASSASSYAPGSATTYTPATTTNGKDAQRWRKKTKQLATLGPASCTFEMIEQLFLAGADVFRLNFSHGEHAQKKDLLDIIRAVEQKYDHPIAVLGDLQGPKLRVGTFANPDGELLTAGQIFRFDSDPTPGTKERVLLPHPEIIAASEVGHALLIDDGKVKVRVVATGPGYLDCEVEVPGKIKDKKVRYWCVWILGLLFYGLCLEHSNHNSPPFIL